MFSEITPLDLKEKLENETRLHLLDVREAGELALAKITDYPLMHIPLNQLPQRYRELPEGADIFIICRSGNRSGQACQYLAGLGYKVTNLKGGLLRWAEDVDPEMEID